MNLKASSSLTRVSASLQQTVKRLGQSSALTITLLEPPKFGWHISTFSHLQSRSISYASRIQRSPTAPPPQSPLLASVRSASGISNRIEGTRDNTRSLHTIGSRANMVCSQHLTLLSRTLRGEKGGYKGKAKRKRGGMFERKTESTNHRPPCLL